MLILISAKNPAVAWLCAAMAVAGSMVGSTILFSAARSGSGRFAKQPEPGSRAARFRNWFRRYGLVTVFIPALIPIPMPLKLFVVSAGVLGTPLAEFGAVVVVARILRYFGEVWLGIQLGNESATFLKTHVWHFTGGALLLFALLYGFIRWRDSRAQSDGNQPA